jgi:SAM-dependent methyltransferase
MLKSELLPWVEAAGDLGDHLLEIGPGPGLTTDLLRQKVARVTAVEIDPSLGAPLRDRLAGSNVEVIIADATEACLPSDSFSSAACFSILHHMPTVAHQDTLFAALSRVLIPGGIFVGQESLDLESIRAGHADDTFTPVDPEQLADRLAAVGFRETKTNVVGFHFQFVTRKPH